MDRRGLEVRVTGLERTLVDVLDRPYLSGTWEEIWRSFDSVDFFDLDKVVEYSILLGNAITAAKVGFFFSSIINLCYQIFPRILEILFFS